MPKDLFRKSSMDRLSSPDQLNDYLKVARPGIWALLIGIGAVLAGFAAWGIFGQFLETVVIPGTVLAGTNNTLVVRSYVPIQDGRLISPGMEARIEPQFAPSERYGYLKGEVTSVSEMPLSPQEIRAELGESANLIDLPETGNLIEVVVAVNRDESGVPVWSRPEGQTVDVPVGSVGSVAVVTGQRNPLSMFFSGS